MRLILIPVLALLLKPSISLSAEKVYGDNLLLAYCEKVVVDNFDYIFVELSRDYPGMAEVKIVYTDKRVKSIRVGINEWQENSISLPSEENGATYRLFLAKSGWNVLKSYSDSSSLHPIYCSARI